MPEDQKPTPPEDRNRPLQAAEIRDRLDKLEEERTASKVKASSDSAPIHGLCSSTSCPTCLAQAEEIALKSYRRGQKDLADTFDEALLYSGGEDLRERVTRLVAQGHILAKGQRVTITTS